MADIATISLRADTSSLEQGDKALDHFGQTAEKATKQADGLNDAFKAGAQSQKQNNESLKQQQQALQDLLAKINPVNNALNKLDDMQLQLSKFRSQGIVDDRTYRESAVAIGRARQELTAAAEASTKAGRAAAEQAAADRAATTAKENFITRLREQTELQGKTASQVQEYKAAQLGMTQQAAPFIAKLKEQEDAWKKGTVSAGQYRMAMRQLPMQFTDIATSIAGGMPLYMIAIQQGGQIKDSFGGIGNASKALLSLITPMTVGLVGAAAVVGGLALAYYKGAAENEEFNKQLILTGNYAGRTASQLQAMAKGLSGNGLTQSALSAAMAKVVGTGSFDSSQIEMVTLAAAKMEQATGQSIDATVNNFKRLQNEPLKAAKELDDQLHYLTASEYEQISAMERSGNTIGAARVAMESYSKAMRERADEVVNNVGYMERSWNSLKNTASKAWDAMLGVGRPDSMNMQIQSKLKELEAAEKRVTLLEKNTPKSVMDADSASPIIIRSQERVREARDLVANLKKEYEELNQKSTDDGLVQGRAKAAQDEQTLLKKNLQTREELENKYGNKASQKAIELKKLELDRGVLTAEKYEEYKAVIEKKYADKKSAQPKSYQDDAATKALLDSQARVAALREQATVTLTMTDQEKQLAKFTQQIADLKSKTILTADQKSLLARSGEITASMQLEAQLSRENAERKKATAALKQMDDYTTTIANRNAQAQAKFGKTSKQAARVDQEFQLDNTFDKQKEGVTGAALEKLTESYNKAKFELKAGFDQEDLNEGYWLAGMTQGLEQYGETANNVFSATAQLAQTTMGSMTSMATQMMTTGSANVKQFATNFLTSIVDIINRLLIAQAIQAAMGWMSGGASAGAGAVSGTASSASAGAMGMSTSFRAYDVGGYTGDGGKFEPKGVVHGGEFVFTKEATNRIGIDNLYKMMRGYADGGLVSNAVTATAPMLGMQGGGNNITVGIGDVVIMSDSQKENNASNSQDIGAGIQKQLKPAIVATISEQLRIPGTPLWMAMNGNR
ncbi:TPA: phage tail tape measure protein [Yersinia enterocolitica]|uniref:phage tail tape measure protein n=2 Tax=Yersinia enterocolitica TaxID=630 RepID=UPI0032F1B01D|nr:phage tail tape measure protein [Yersinia enterocolitica]HDL7329754.1 phage tail tape measure protein [Yersinia enterocolitica]HDL7355883.1 phage tail tape measure protein [Yersinia enterocolitica]HDL8228781.1 phage tail tape measure protein [Yersinia enterocolitica]HDQ4038662.1 phage tail tape measure protein [Yersinia enterocolitica]